MLTLPENNRHFFKEPFGELFTNLSEVIPRLSGHILYTVGDVVTHNVIKQGIVPSIAIVDGHTMRSPCKKNPPITGRHIGVKNPAGSLTDELIAGIMDAIKNPPATIDVTGEEDLAVIPLVLEAPIGSIVLYGQPYKGVVLRPVDHEAKRLAKELLAHFIIS
ncbi:MAG: hypothetical protein A4E35_00274 [Methanoregula sp. PtaU1.Bin051]|nr:MAG: hypothetical protein A4E35_00274 [Methanoregula sp. PtaU1.Bin051]